MKNTHTPGPWIPVLCRDGESWRVVRDQNEGIGERRIAENIQQGRDNGEADARLIAAAPQMVEALREILKMSASMAICKIPHLVGLGLENIRLRAIDAIQQATDL